MHGRVDMAGEGQCHTIKTPHVNQSKRTTLVSFPQRFELAASIMARDDPGNKSLLILYFSSISTEEYYMAVLKTLNITFPDDDCGFDFFSWLGIHGLLLFPLLISLVDVILHQMLIHGMKRSMITSGPDV